MACEPGCDCCGTGTAALLPNDPNMNDQVLSARSGFNGIAVSWTYPDVNAHAIAYTTLHRSLQNNFDTAVVIATVGGDYYFDQADVVVGTQYFYWIRAVSINGTVGGVIGPASAVMQPTMEAMIELLTGRISSSELNVSLKTELNKITDVSSSLDDEVQARLFGENIYTQLLEGFQAQLLSIDTLVVNEITERITGDSALVAEVDLILAKSVDNAAAILTEQGVRADAVSAVAQRSTTLEATVGVSTVISQDNTEVVIDPNGMYAERTMKFDVDGRVSGLGFRANATESFFEILTDNFAIGKPGSANKFPFIIGDINGETQIVLNANTLIPDASIGNLMIGQYIQSNNYNGTGVGWRINKAGEISGSAINIMDAAGNTVLSAGNVGSVNIADFTEANVLNNNTQWAEISGAGRPADNAQVNTINAGSGLNALDSAAHTKLGGIAPGADVTSANTAAAVLNQGAFATLSAITATNIGTYIAGAAIDTAFIKNAAIKTALIDNLAVGTLQIADSAVTASDAVEVKTPVTILTGFISVASIVVNVPVGESWRVTCIATTILENYGGGFLEATYQLTRNGTVVWGPENSKIYTTGSVIGSTNLGQGVTGTAYSGIEDFPVTMLDVSTGLTQGSYTFALQVKANLADSLRAKHAAMLITGLKK